MIDIHMHSTYSDGDKTVEELLKMCEEKRLEYISITDHNTCAAKEALETYRIMYTVLEKYYNGRNDDFWNRVDSWDKN